MFSLLKVKSPNMKFPQIKSLRVRLLRTRLLKIGIQMVKLPMSFPWITKGFITKGFKKKIIRVSLLKAGLSRVGTLMAYLNKDYQGMGESRLIHSRLLLVIFGWLLPLVLSSLLPYIIQVTLQNVQLDPKMLYFVLIHILIIKYNHMCKHTYIDH